MKQDNQLWGESYKQKL